VKPSLLGILMLDTAFPRPLGDAGNPASWRVPVRLQVVPRATPAQVVRHDDAALLQAFVAAAQHLVREGATAITTSCGFLVRWQQPLQEAVPVPVWTSSLLMLPQLQQPGVVTAEAGSLTVAHWRAAGAAPDTPVQGLALGCHLHDTLLNNRTTLDARAAEQDAVRAAQALVAAHADVQHIVLECTNLPPYAAAIRAATGRPVHHLVSMVESRLGLCERTRCA
jgi:Asp/Glu/hydantoin racemase